LFSADRKEKGSLFYCWLDARHSSAARLTGRSTRADHSSPEAAEPHRAVPCRKAVCPVTRHQHDPSSDDTPVASLCFARRLKPYPHHHSHRTPPGGRQAPLKPPDQGRRERWRPPHLHRRRGSSWGASRG
jgi:hypothetical protein